MIEWLQSNKVFFETIAATLLSLMAIIVAVVQIIIANKQNTLTEIQTKIAQHQYEREERLLKIEATANWGELRNSMWGIIDLFPPSGIETIRSIPQEYQISLFKKVRLMLDSQIKNPVLIENEQCLGHWRNAISTAKTISFIIEKLNVPASQDQQDHIVASAIGISEDVMYVWSEIVLNSDEISATGGRPMEKKDKKQEVQ